MNNVAIPPADPYDGNPKKQPFGKGFLPSFHALWHLKTLGVVDDLMSFESAAWATAQASERSPVRVAVIDTPVAHHHPNLVGAIDLGLARDFSVFDTGAFVQRVVEGEDKESRRWLISRLPESTGNPIEEGIKEEVGGKDLSRYVPQPYGAHGTAIAGLIGARPVEIRLRKPAKLGAPPMGREPEEAEESTPGPLPLPYAGINPFCRIVPISTTAAPYPKMVKAAIDYACLIEAQVVVIAAEWADDLDRTDKKDTSEHAKPGDGKPGDKEVDWSDVDDALLALSKTALVFCAAGNLKADMLSYPASLSRNKGKLRRPWAITACDETATLLSYAPETLKGYNMLRTLSTEHPRYDREGIRLDPYAARDPELYLPDPDKDYPPRQIIATDPPGRWGYNPSPFEHDPGDDPHKEHFEIGSLFCRFSGTSAATAIAAGLASLAIAMGPKGKPNLPQEPEKKLLDLQLARSLFG